MQDVTQTITDMALDIMHASSLPLEISGAIATDLYNEGYRKGSNTRYMLKADGNLEMIPTVESVTSEVISEFKELVKQLLIDRDLYPVLVKNALEYAEKIIKGE